MTLLVGGEGDAARSAPVMTPDGRYLLYAKGDFSGRDIWEVPLGPKGVTECEGHEHLPGQRARRTGRVSGRHIVGIHDHRSLDGTSVVVPTSAETSGRADQLMLIFNWAGK